jgi:hypothetical protein
VSLDAIDVVRGKTARICPLVCEHGYKAYGERCVKISSGSGFFYNDDNEWEKKRDEPSATREETPARREKPKREQVQYR